MSARPATLAPVALLLAALIGAAVGSMSHLSAVSQADPRPTGLVLPTRAPTPSSTPEESASVTATATAAATQTPEPEREVWLYQVQQGDSVSGIAIRYGTTTEELLDLNPEYRENENLIEAGAQVIVPCTPIAQAEDRC